ncbi:MAG: DUF4331 family protein [Gemmatimonadota bacterium]
MKNLIKLMTALAALGLPIVLAACEEDETGPEIVMLTDTIRIGMTNVSFVQLERLGNPLVSEVLIEKREHVHHNISNPAEDRAQFRDDLVTFITAVAGRDAAYAGAVADALLPDMLFIRMDKLRGANDANVGWLSYVLDPANGYGGRKLAGDDVVDKGLAVLFGAALGNNNNVSAGLVSDNVPANDRAHAATFPYLASAN